MFLLLILVIFFGQTGVDAETSYTAAVYEHKVILNKNPRVLLSRQEALRHMRKNLDVYEKQVEIASFQGAQIIVFPEDGIHGFLFTRSSISSYLETVPDPQKETWNPCVETDRYNNTEVLQRLSCMARRYNLYLVANMADLQPCPLQSDPSSTCPSDGHWHFNTNVVFSSNGTLVARYHKHNLYFEEAFNTPPQVEIVTFDTPFAGKFGLIICFDILFHEPTVTLLRRGVRQLIFPTAWMNQLPLLDSIQFQQAFSLGANITLLAPNLRNDQLKMTGSGIFSPWSATYHHALQGEPEEGKLLVARVPVLDEEWLAQSTVTEELNESGFRSIVFKESEYCDSENCPDSSSPAPPNFIFTSPMMYDSFKFVLLNDTEGKVSVCDSTLCCYLQYEWIFQNEDELYALGAFADTHTKNGRYALQVCAVVRCAGLESSSCGEEVEEAESKMDFLLEGTFQTEYVYPAILTSQYVLEHPEKLEKTAEGKLGMKHSNMTQGLVTASLYGRMYHLDDE